LKRAHLLDTNTHHMPIYLCQNPINHIQGCLLHVEGEAGANVLLEQPGPQAIFQQFQERAMVGLTRGGCSGGGVRDSEEQQHTQGTEPDEHSSNK
jgi:hypothetical protein